VGDAGIMALIQVLKANQTLKYLRLSGIKVDEESTRAIRLLDDHRLLRF